LASIHGRHLSVGRQVSQVGRLHCGQVLVVGFSLHEWQVAMFCSQNKQMSEEKHVIQVGLWQVGQRSRLSCAWHMLQLGGMGFRLLQYSQLLFGEVQLVHMCRRQVLQLDVDSVPQRWHGGDCLRLLECMWR
jgi:hypothetical protein